jgi:ribosome-associated translation inhibitor RaiA
MPDPTVAVSFKDTPHSDRVHDAVEKRCAQLAEEFPETTKFEVTLAAEGAGFSATGHVTGRSTDVAGHADGDRPGQAADRLLDKLERALRKVHDKKIFKNRREARKADVKRNTAP